ncbi:MULTISPECIES: hypothetical protein [unclassified Cryobacterium]|uniref:hypothetical protein n=1 Tax=unclassified Cryobacterium TaxID=2649013 RepID=UPI001446C405|nr:MULTISPECIES: hypothetical protein [unclassified Cryobacterium]
MSDIRIDFDRLDRADQRLNTVLADFTSVGELSAHVPDIAGHAAVAGATRDFRDAWSIRRERLTEELTFVRESVVAIRDTFRALDSELEARVTAFTSTEGGA